MEVIDKIFSLTKQLYPKGRAFKMPVGGDLEKLHLALRVSETQAFNDAKSILFDLLPDNDNFTSDDATDWEGRLGMITNTAVALSDRKLAIQRKLNYPGVNKARGSHLSIEEQLQAAGFNVYVYENRFSNYPDGYITRDPVDVYGTSAIIQDLNHGEFNHGEENHGGIYNNIIANSITQAGDIGFDIGGNFRKTFFIGGTPIGTYADVPAEREEEFRQLILRLKPQQTVGFLFINYV